MSAYVFRGIACCLASSSGRRSHRIAPINIELALQVCDATKAKYLFNCQVHNNSFTTEQKYTNNNAAIHALTLINLIQRLLNARSF